LVSTGLAVQTSSNGLLEFVNAAFASLHGYLPTELRGVPGEALIAAGDRAEWREAIQSSIRTEGCFSLEIHRLKKDGSTFPCLVRFTPMPGELGGQQLLEVLDRAEQNNLTQALNQERSLLIASFQRLPLPVFVLSPELDRILIQSDAVYELFPDSRQVTKQALEKMHGAVMTAMRHVTKHSGVKGLKIEAIDSGLIDAVELVSNPIFNPVGEVIAVAVVIHSL
jgi:PAS domain S-box-containing protein